MPKFNDNENIKSDQLISKYIRELTHSIKTAEENIRVITYSEVKNESEKPSNLPNLL